MKRYCIATSGGSYAKRRLQNSYVPQQEPSPLVKSSVQSSLTGLPQVNHGEPSPIPDISRQTFQPSSMSNGVPLKVLLFRWRYNEAGNAWTGQGKAALTLIHHVQMAESNCIDLNGCFVPPHLKYLLISKKSLHLSTLLFNCCQANSTQITDLL